MSDNPESIGTLESREAAGAGGAGIVKYWLGALDIAHKAEANWRTAAAETEAIYQGGTGKNAKAKRAFNILFSNTETIAAACYNSSPVPDIRRRFSDQDDAGRAAAQVLERCVSYAIDQYDVDSTFRPMVRDGLVAGRGMVRVKYMPIIVDNRITYENVECEYVEWRQFRHGPARTWANVPWIAFQHFLTRDGVKALNPRLGNTMNLEHSIPHSGGGDSDGSPVEDQFKRGEVWEIWDKASRQVIYIAPAMKEQPLQTTDDPLGLEGFFPVPRPFVPVEVPGSLEPVEPYRLYRGLAEELDRLTVRCQSLIRGIRWRGAYLDPQIGDFLAKFEKLEDGEMAPVENPAAMNGGLDKAFWFQPTEQASAVLVQLYQAREMTKQAIYEVTGISDLLRGQSNPQTTATAEGIKQQWGSLRVSGLQAEVARVARDVIRLKVEIIAEKYSPESLQAMSGMQLDEQVIGLLKSDPLRRYRVDVETDSTIRADLQRQQQNVAGFVAGFGAFIQAVGPAVQAGALPMPVVTEMVKSFSRVFKLGRSVEEALDSMPQQIPSLQGDEQARKADVEKAAQAEGIKAQVEEKKMQAQMQMKQMDNDAQGQRDAMKIAADDRREEAKMALEREKMMLEREKMMIDQQKTAADNEMKVAGHNLAVDTASASGQRDDRRFGLDREVADAGAVAGTGAGLGQGGQLLADIQTTLGEVQQTMAVLNETGQAMAQMLTASKKIIRGKDNKVTGVELVGTGIVHQVERGPDGRMSGIGALN